jgi:hypothetical protein
MQVDWRDLRGRDLPATVLRISYPSAVLDSLRGGQIDLGRFVVGPGDMRHMTIDILNTSGGAQSRLVFFIRGLYCENPEQDAVEYCALAMLASTGAQGTEECSLHLRIATQQGSSQKYFAVPCPTSVTLMDKFELAAMRINEEVLLKKYEASGRSCAVLDQECLESAENYCSESTQFIPAACQGGQLLQSMAARKRICARLAAYCHDPLDRSALFR